MFSKAFTVTVLVVSAFVLAPTSASASVPNEAPTPIMSVQGSGGAL